LTRIPFGLYPKSVLRSAFALCKDELLRLTDVDELLRILARGCFEDDGGQIIFGSPIADGIQSAEPEEILARLIIDATCMDGRLDADGGVPVSKHMAEILYILPIYRIQRIESGRYVRQVYYSIRNVNFINFGPGVFGYDVSKLQGSKKKRAYRIPDFMGSISEDTYTYPEDVTFGDLTSWYIPYSGDRELKKIILSLGDALGGVTIESDCVVIDSPGILHGIGEAMRLRKSLYLRTAMAQYIIAVAKEAVPPGGNILPSHIRIFSTKTSNSATTSYHKMYRKDDTSEVFAPYSHLPPAGIDFSRLSHFYGV
jgi:hypothetical protein